MHRFRKKSDAKKNQLPILPPLQISFTAPTEHQQPTFELPSADDFRTSLILPDLSRRFSLLRNSSGDPLPVDVLRSRLAEQRARGAENQVTEEEEEMILESLGLRTKYSSKSQENVTEDSMRQSMRSTNSSLSHSPSIGRSAKRYSNNLFGSGRLRDYSYVRTATQGRHGGSRTTSAAPSESSLNPQSSYSGSLRPVTPENSAGSSTQSSPDEKRGTRSAPLIPPSPYGEHTMSSAEYRLSKSLGSSVLKRASLALEEAIREIEEDVEDEIVMPRSAPISRQNADQYNTQKETSSNRLSDVYEAGMAILPDTQHRPEKEERRASPIPSRILPGYIPGMPRPMTPREDTDNEVLRSHSTTPRATSPSSSKMEPSSPTTAGLSNQATGLFRNNSSTSFSRQSSRPTSPSSPSPMFLQRSPTSGHYSPDVLQRGERSADGSVSGSHDASSVPSRRRPASPLSGPSYQPFTAAATVSTSRPSTPSNVTWTFPSKSLPQKTTDHNRNGSWFSDESTDTHGGASSFDHSKSGSRSLRSPALPDSPLIDRGHTNMASFSSNYSGTSDNRPPSAISGIDLNSPQTSPINRMIRSPTPTQSPSRSPTSPIFSGLDTSPRNTSRRSSKQHTPSSALSLFPYGPVVFSPLANSSRSSLESIGSSYHSWEGDQKDRLYPLLDADSHQPAWHDISFPSQSSSTTPGGSPDIEWDAEDVISRYGLHKSDFSAIQEKLVDVANAKTSVTPETRDRVPSLRRRRPSTSQSNYSLNGRDVRIAAQAQPAASSQTADTFNSEQISLLNSVVNSINTQSNPPPLQTSSPSNADITSSTTTSDISPTTRRNRDLAQVLFGIGNGEEATGEEPSASTLHPLSSEDADPSSDPPKEAQPTPLSNTPPLSALPFSSSNSGISPDVPSPLYNPLRSPSTPRIPQTPEAEEELAREVQRKTDAAMVALKKKPSNSNLSREALTSPGSTRKKINPNQISTPTLVSASTSVDTIPLRTPPLSGGPPSKIGSRFRKLRGTLKKTNMPTAEEITPYPLDLRSPTSSQSQSQFAQYDPQRLHPNEPAASATELGRFKVPSVPVPSPPASAGPGLKGFMARFRGKQRHDASIDYKAPPQRFSPIPHSPLQDRSAPRLQVPNNVITSPRDFNAQFSYPAPSPHSSHSPHSPHSQQPSSASEAVSDGADAHESMAIKQLFDAASNLGLDQRKLSELLVRSGSTSSRSTEWTMLTRNNSNVTQSKPESRLEGQTDNLSPRSDWVTFEDAGVRMTKPLPLSRKSSLKQPQPSENVGVRRPRQQAADTNTIVRRTIIFPDNKGMSAADLNALVRKGSNRRRRASAMSTTSTSSRSIHERAPTPPPPRSPTTRRFSEDNSPPVPQLPPSLMSRMDQNFLSVPSPSAGGPVEKSSSAYDSLYEMYAGEGKQANAGTPEAGSSAQRDGPPEHGPALEVIELANGEMIWSIVNGLRDDDLDSVYTGRSSFQSEYDHDEGVQVFVKDHTRGGSKGSNSSFFSRRKQGQGKNRPETKVFYSSSAQIGRLIENLSQGMDAGAFNFLPHHAGHSAASSLSGQTASDAHLTVEERLERMLGAMRTS